MTQRNRLLDIAAAVSFVALIAWWLLTDFTSVSTPTGFVWSWYGRIYDWHKPWIWTLREWRGPVGFSLEILPVWWTWTNRQWWCAGLKRALGIKPPDPNACKECGYNLTGNVSGICPECGTPILHVPDDRPP